MPIQGDHGGAAPAPKFLRATTIDQSAQSATYAAVPFDTVIENEAGLKFGLDVSTNLGRITVGEAGVLRVRANAVFENTDAMNGATVDLRIVRDPVGTPEALDHATQDIAPSTGAEVGTLEVNSMFEVEAADVIEVQLASTDTDVELFAYNDTPSAHLVVEWFPAP